MFFKRTVLIFWGICFYWSFINEISTIPLKKEKLLFVNAKNGNILIQRKSNEKENAVYRNRNRNRYRNRKRENGNQMNLSGIRKTFPATLNELKNHRLYLLSTLKNTFSFFNFFGKDEDERYTESIKKHINDLTRIKQLSFNKKSNHLKKESLKSLMLYILFSRVNFRILNNVSFILRQFKIETTMVRDVLNEISKCITTKKQAYNFLTLYFFLLKNENVTLSLMLHVLDFFGSKDNVSDALQNIKKQIYDECVNELLKKKIEKYALMCEKKKKKFDFHEALDKAELNEREDELHFYFDKDLFEAFKLKKNDLKWKKTNNKLNKKLFGESPGIEPIIPKGAEQNSLDTDNEALQNLKQVYEDLQKFKEMIIQYIEKDQELFYFAEEEVVETGETGESEGKEGKEGLGLKLEGMGVGVGVGVGDRTTEVTEESKNISGTSGISNITRKYKIKQMELEKEKEKEKEKEMNMRKNIDDFLASYTKGCNKTIDDFKNYFIEQADKNFKKFLNNLKESSLSGKVPAGENGKASTSSSSSSSSSSSNVFESSDISHGSNFEDDFYSNMITDFQLQKLNDSEYDLDLTKEEIFERIRMKLLYFIQKMEYFKYQYHYEILNATYPIVKNEKTLLDILQYGYKIVISPDVDNSIFQNEKKKGVTSLTLGKVKSGEHVTTHSSIPQTSDQDSSEKVLVCPQCKVKA